MTDTSTTLLQRHLRALFLALGFFTRLPTKQLNTIEDQDMGRALVYLPVVGLIIGVLITLFGLGLSQFIQLWHEGQWHGELSLVNRALTGFAVFTALTLVSGGLHLDGLGDCADAWVGGLGDKERTLAIMKDPTCGPMAVMAVVLTLIVKAGAVLALVLNSQWLALIFIPVLSRCASLALFLTRSYVRPKGLGQAFADFSGNPQTASECRLALLLGLALPALLLAAAWPVLLITLLLWHWLSRQSQQRIQGFTGDVCGAVIEITEAFLLFGCAFMLA